MFPSPDFTSISRTVLTFGFLTDVMVILDFPLYNALMTPSLLTETISGLLDLYFTFFDDTPIVDVTTNCDSCNKSSRLRTSLFTAIAGVAGAFWTVIVQVDLTALLDFDVTVIVAFPAFLADTFPLLLTDTIAALLDLKVTALDFKPFTFFTLNVSASPTYMVVFFRFNVIDFLAVVAACAVIGDNDVVAVVAVPLIAIAVVMTAIANCLNNLLMTVLLLVIDFIIMSFAN